MKGSKHHLRWHALGNPDQRYAPNGMLRSLRCRGYAPGFFDTGDHFWLTVQIGTGFRVCRSAGSRFHADAAQFGRVFMDCPGDRLHIAAEGEVRILQLKLPNDLAVRYLQDDHGIDGNLSAFRLPQGEVDLELSRLLLRAMLAPKGCGDVAVREVVAHLVARHGDRNRPPFVGGLSPQRLRRVRDFVTADTSAVTVAAMAAEAELSVFHFSREFKRETGRTPWAFVAEQRVWSAIRLLSAADLPLHEVARRSGFAHASHMGRMIRRHLSATPSIVRTELFP